MSFSIQNNFLRLILPALVQNPQDPKKQDAGKTSPNPNKQDPVTNTPAAASTPKPTNETTQQAPRLDDPFRVVIAPLPENLLEITRANLGFTRAPGFGVDIAQATINIKFVTRKMALPLNRAAFDPHEPMAFKTTNWLAILAPDNTPLEFNNLRVDHSRVTGFDSIIVDRDHRGDKDRKSLDFLTLMVAKENEVPPFLTDEMVASDHPKLVLYELYLKPPEHGEISPDKDKTDYVFKMNPRPDNVVWDFLGLAKDNVVRKTANEISDKEITLSKGLPSLSKNGWQKVHIDSLLDSGMLTFGNLSFAPALNGGGSEGGEAKDIYSFVGNLPPEVQERAQAAHVEFDPPSDSAKNNAAFGVKELITRLGKRGQFDTRMEAVDLDVWEKPKSEQEKMSPPVAPDQVDAQPGLHIVARVSVDSPSRLELADRDQIVRACPDFANVHQNLREASIFHTGPRADGIPQFVTPHLSIVNKPAVKEETAAKPGEEKKAAESEFKLSVANARLSGNIFAPATSAVELGQTTFVIKNGELATDTIRYDDLTQGLSLEMPQGIHASIKRLAAGYGYGTCADYMMDGIPAPKDALPDQNGNPDISAREVPATIPFLRFTWKDPKDPDAPMLQGEIENFQYNAAVNDVHLPDQYSKDQLDLFGRSVLDRLLMNIIKDIPQNQLIDGLRLKDNQVSMAHGTIRFTSGDMDLKLEIASSAINLNKDGDVSKVNKPAGQELVTQVTVTVAVKSGTYKAVTSVKDLQAILQTKFAQESGKTELKSAALKDTRIDTTTQYEKLGDTKSKRKINAMLEVFFAGIHQQNGVITMDRDISARIAALIEKDKDHYKDLDIKISGTNNDQGSVTYDRNKGELRANGKMPTATVQGTDHDGNKVITLDQRIKPVLKDCVVAGIGDLIDKGVGVLTINGQATFKTSTKIEVSVDGIQTSMTLANVDLWTAIKDGKITVYKKDNGKAGLRTRDSKDISEELSKSLDVNVEIENLVVKTDNAVINTFIPGDTEKKKPAEWHEIHLPFKVELQKVALLDLLSDAPTYAATVLAGNKGMGGISYVFHKGTEDSAPFVVMNIEEIDSKTTLAGDDLTSNGHISGVTVDTQSGTKKFHGVLDNVEEDLKLTGLKAAIQNNFDKLDTLNGTFEVRLKGRDNKLHSVRVRMQELDEKKKQTDLMLSLREAYAKMKIDGKANMLVKLEECLLPLIDIDGVFEGDKVHGTDRLKLSDLQLGTVTGFNDWAYHNGKSFTVSSAQGHLENTLDLVIETPEGEVTTIHADTDLLAAIKDGVVTVNENAEGKPTIQKKDGKGNVKDLAKDLSDALGHSISIKAITVNTLKNNQITANIAAKNGERTWINVPLPATTIELKDLVINPQQVAAQMSVEAKGIHAYYLKGRTKNGSNSPKDLDDKQPYDVFELSIDQLKSNEIVFDSTQEGGFAHVNGGVSNVSLKSKHGSDPWGESEVSLQMDSIMADIDMKNLNEAIAQGKFNPVQGGFTITMKSVRDPKRQYDLFAKIIDSQLPSTFGMMITGNVTTGVFNPNGPNGDVAMLINNINDRIEMDAKFGKPGDEQIYHNVVPSVNIPTRVYRDGKIEVALGPDEFMSLFNTAPTRNRVMLQNGVTRMFFGTGNKITYWKLTNDQKNQVDQLVDTLNKEGFVPGGDAKQNLRALSKVLGQSIQSSAVQDTKRVLESDYNGRYADALTRILMGPEFVQAAAAGEAFLQHWFEGEAFVKDIPVRKVTWEDLSADQKERAPRYNLLQDKDRKKVSALLQSFLNSGYVLGGGKEKRQNNLDALARFQFKKEKFDQLDDKQKNVVYELFDLAESALPPIYYIKDDPTMDYVTKLALGDEFAHSKGKEAFDLLTPAEQNQLSRFENLSTDDFAKVLNAATEGRVLVDLASTPNLSAIARMIYTADYQAQKKAPPSFYELSFEQRKTVLTIAKKATYVYHGDKAKNLAAIAAMFPKANATTVAKLYEFAEANVSGEANLKFTQLGFKSDAIPVVHAMPIYVERANFNIVMVPKKEDEVDPNHHADRPDESLRLRGTTLDFKGEVYHGPDPAITKSGNDKVAYLPHAVTNATMLVGLDAHHNPSSQGKVFMQSGTFKRHLPGQIGAPDEKQFLVDYNDPAMVSKPYDPDLPSGKKIETPETDGVFTRLLFGKAKVEATGVETGTGKQPSAYAVGFIEDGAIRAIDVVSLFGVRPLTKIPPGAPWTELPLFDETLRQSDNSAKAMIIGLFDIAGMGVDHELALADKRVNGTISFTDPKTEKPVALRVREGIVYYPDGKTDGKASMDEHRWAKFIWNNQKYVWQFPADGKEDWAGHKFTPDAR